MKRLTTCLFLIVLLSGFACENQSWAQDQSEVEAAADGNWPPYRPAAELADPHSIYRGPGGYFAGWKLVLITVVFLVWVKLADWINRDSIKFKSQHELYPQVWNPLVLVSFMLGLFGAVINIPFFLLGFPAYLLGAFVPFSVYLFMRSGKTDPEALEKEINRDEDAPPGEMLDLPIQFKPAGNSSDEKQGNLILARQHETFPLTAQMLHDGVYRRVEQIICDYTREAVTRKMQIDGAWLDMEMLDRPTGDAMLVSLKHLAGLNPADRRSKQRGQFNVKVKRIEVGCLLSTQGTQTGERVQLKFDTEQKQPTELVALGMWPDMYQHYRSVANGSGFVVVSSPPGQGLSTTWRAILHGADRFTRDWVSVIDENEIESEMENIEPSVFYRSQGQNPASVLSSLVLRQPSCYVIPDFVDAQSIDLMSEEVLENERLVVSRINARNAAEAILRTMVTSDKNRKRYAQGVQLGICQRLVRRLCVDCRQALAPNPKLIQQLGGNPQDPPTIYTHFQPPPPEQLLDEKGRPIEVPKCPTCNGIGYLGRIAIFEMLTVDDKLRKVIVEEPKLDKVIAVAQKQGHLSLPQQGYRLVLEGITSIQEIQRVMK